MWTLLNNNVSNLTDTFAPLGFNISIVLASQSKYILSIREGLYELDDTRKGYHLMLFGTTYVPKSRLLFL